jgi:hypothetical protein
VWRCTDPRRARIVRIVDMCGRFAMVENLSTGRATRIDTKNLRPRSRWVRVIDGATS